MYYKPLEFQRICEGLVPKALYGRMENKSLEVEDDMIELAWRQITEI